MVDLKLWMSSSPKQVPEDQVMRGHNLLNLDEHYLDS